MPYVRGDRDALEPDPLKYADDPGELNFQITFLAADYIERHGLNYGNLNAVVGALECAKQEFLRRVVAPYEDKKIAANGDVYPKEILS